MLSPHRPQCVLVTGGAGYLGSIVVSQLLSRGVHVRILDCLLFGGQSIEKLRSHANCEFILGDIRDIGTSVRAMDGCDTVIHLAGIVGDQACEANRELAVEVNAAATRMLAEIAPRCGIHRFLFASSCSVYGSSRATVAESSRLHPLSLYAQTKVDSERVLVDACTRGFAPTVLRLGTLFGVSPRMRFDLVLNLLAARAVSVGRITVRNGRQWRPFVHVRDAARAFLACIDSQAERVAGEIFNVGSSFLNAQIRQLGEIVAHLVPGTAVTGIYDRLDQRSYRVRFDKIERTLGFVCRETLEAGVREVSAAVAADGISNASADRSPIRMSTSTRATTTPIHVLPSPRAAAVRATLRRKTGPAVPLGVAASTSKAGD